jgi:hypothetical protein
MKSLLVMTAATLSLATVSPPLAMAAAGPSTPVGKISREFDKDARAFGHSIEALHNKVRNEMASGAVQIVAGPAGEVVELVGDVTAEAGLAVDGEYQRTKRGLKCIAKDPINPFKDSGCIVQYGGRTLALVIATADDGTEIVIVAAADTMSEVFNGFKHVMNSAANATGRMSNPVGAFFVLTYNVSNLTEMAVRFALVDIGARSVSILAEQGTKIVAAPLSALYDVVTLRWGRAGIKIFNLPERLLNSAVNIPVEIIFGRKQKDLVLRTLSPLGRWVDHGLGLNPAQVNKEESGQ